MRLLRVYRSRGSKVLVFVGAGDSPLRVAVQADRLIADKGVSGIKVRRMGHRRPWGRKGQRGSKRDWGGGSGGSRGGKESSSEQGL